MSTHSYTPLLCSRTGQILHSTYAVNQLINIPFKNPIFSSFPLFSLSNFLGKQTEFYLGKQNHGAELGRDFPDEAGVGGEPVNVALVAAVDEDGAQSVGPHPVLRTDEVPLREPGMLREAEVVEALREIPRFVSDFFTGLLLSETRLGFAREVAEEARGPFG